MQLLNIALGIVIVLVYVNAESTAPEKPVELSITPAKEALPNEFDIVLPYVVKKYFQVTGKIIKKIENRRRLPSIVPMIAVEEFYAPLVTDYAVNRWSCDGIKYSYPSPLLNVIDHHPIEKEITEMIRIISNGTCFPYVMDRHQNKTSA
uniref:Sperm-lysin n=1 Tax=Cacopsylla melanoneura TaxID=428564 RepID=A0A8D9ETI2_9HEMI